MYCEDGKVFDFEVLENRIEAEVAGSDYYHVSIDSFIRYMICLLD